MAYSALVERRESDEARPATHENPTVVERIVAYAGSLPQISLEYEPDSRLLWITLRPEPKPVFTLPSIQSVLKVQHAVRDLWGTSADRPVLFLAFRGRGAVFSLGGDLDYYLDCLAANDRDGLHAYAAAAAEVIGLNRSGVDGCVITLATVHAKALGGGIDPARACNVMVAEEAASFCYPEVNYNHFPISAVPILSRHAGFIEAEKILMGGRDHTAAEFAARGVLDAVVPNGSGEDWVRAYARAALPTHSARVSVIAAINRQAGDLSAELARAVSSWVSHILTLKPLEISKLQRIAAAQERMLGRLVGRDRALLDT
jgi:DSF synthase